MPRYIEVSSEEHDHVERDDDDNERDDDERDDDDGDEEIQSGLTIEAVPESGPLTSSLAMEQVRLHHMDLPPELEAEILRVLLRPIDPTLTYRIGNENRERALGELFATLTVETAYQLSRRLDLSRPDDPLAVAFGRLARDRQLRLQSFLDFTRRRRSGQRR